MWDDISWMYAVRLYTRQGKLRTDKFAMDWILDHFNYSLTEIPSFLNALPNNTVTLPPPKVLYTTVPVLQRTNLPKKTELTKEKSLLDII